MPTIAITSCRQMSDYLESLKRAGGTARIVTSADNAGEIVAAVDGLLLTGGGDIDPALYGAAAHPLFAPAEPGRDTFEIALVRAALDTGTPIFAICRGLQVLNVACGGTLVQDIPSEVAGDVTHAVNEPRFAIAHEVWAVKGSRLSTLMQEHLEDTERCPVNSRHHQAILHAGTGLEVVATAPDGVVEAIEGPGEFCLGVQWHPENFWRTGEFRPLFEGFVDACRRTPSSR